mgnify:CR=1 FL=1
MEKNEMPSTTPIPGVLRILGNGCNLAANHAKLLILPMVLDIILLCGPQLRIAELFQPIFESAYSQMMASVTQSAAAQLESGLSLIISFLHSINLLSSIQVAPIGVSLLNISGSTESPLGKTLSIELTSVFQVIPILIGLIILGVMLGTLYYSIAAQTAAGNNIKWNSSIYGKELLNTILFYVALIILLFVISIPAGCLMMISFMISPVLYQLFFILEIIIGCWIIIPLFYIPHGIFINHYDLTQAIKESFHLASWSAPITIRFIFLSSLISMGLNMIWTIPDASSTMIFVGIFGHAFVSTALLISSFLLFTELEQWQTENQAFLSWRKANLRINKLIKKEPEQHD